MRSLSKFTWLAWSPLKNGSDRVTSSSGWLVVFVARLFWTNLSANVKTNGRRIWIARDDIEIQFDVTQSKSISTQKFDGHASTSIRLYIGITIIYLFFFFSEKVAQRKSASTKKQTSSKILVRNVPFEASKKEIKELFGYV